MPPFRLRGFPRSPILSYCVAEPVRRDPAGVVEELCIIRHVREDTLVFHALTMLRSFIGDHPRYLIVFLNFRKTGPRVRNIRRERISPLASAFISAGLTSPRC